MNTQELVQHASDEMHALEAITDDLIARHSELLASVARLRSDTGVTAFDGQRCIGKFAEGFGHLSAYRKSLVCAHAAAEKDIPSMDWPVRCPGEEEAQGPQLQVVTSLDG